MADEYQKFREQLELQEWPGIYLFKFIVPNDSHAVAQVAALFDEAADLHFQNSKTGKYVSISAKEMMLSAEAVIDRYKSAGHIKGLISL